MEKSDIVQRLKQGWDLTNRGTGWWLSEPRIAYKKTAAIPIPEAIVNEMKKEGIIEFKMPYNSINALLVT
jgi:hypothetical protein